MVLYFSATGNSKYVAELLGEYLEDDVVSANELVASKEICSLVSARPWIFVFPVIISKMPTVFEAFIKKTIFQGNKKAYFVATCQAAAGTSGNCGSRLCKVKGWEFMGSGEVSMPQNYIMSFLKMHDENECVRRIRKARDLALEFGQDIKNERWFTGTKLASGAEEFFTDVVDKMCVPYFNRATKKFYTTKECVGCGRCVKICPMKNISLVDGQIRWGKKCIQCTACVNRCPKEAIEYGKTTIGKERYYCEKYKNKL